MGIYKKDEGMWARAPVAIVGGIITVAVTRSAMALAKPPASYIWGGVAFLALAVATLFLAFFHRKTGDVLIDTESEMRKVVWPNREEIVGSTTVVIATTVLLGLMIYGLDIGLAQFLDLIGLY
ncbi:MAG: preprotein translocase subunit SecE [Planctomycetota bacterium]